MFTNSNLLITLGVIFIAFFSHITHIFHVFGGIDLSPKNPETWNLFQLKRLNIQAGKHSIECGRWKIQRRIDAKRLAWAHTVWRTLPVCGEEKNSQRGGNWLKSSLCACVRASVCGLPSARWSFSSGAAEERLFSLPPLFTNQTIGFDWFAVKF